MKLVQARRLISWEQIKQVEYEAKKSAMASRVYYYMYRLCDFDSFDIMTLEYATRLLGERTEYLNHIIDFYNTGWVKVGERDEQVTESE